MSTTFHDKMISSFPKRRREWVSAKAEYTEDKLEILNQPVMQDWEKPYMKELAKIATRNGGTVLEVGFGMGISAEYIQSHDIHRHVVIEPNHDVFLRLLEFAKSASSKIVPIFGFWQDVVGLLEACSFDGILFDCCATDHDDYYNSQFEFSYYAPRLLKNCGVFTHYINQDHTDAEYISMMHRAGFRSCDGYLVDVNPPVDCEYWNKKQIYAPIIVK